PPRRNAGCRWRSRGRCRADRPTRREIRRASASPSRAGRRSARAPAAPRGIRPRSPSGPALEVGDLVGLAVGPVLGVGELVLGLALALLAAALAPQLRIVGEVAGGLLGAACDLVE